MEDYLMANDYVFNDSLPVAPLKIAALEDCLPLARKVNDYIVSFRKNDTEELLRRKADLRYRGYNVESYLLDCACPRFVTRRSFPGFKEDHSSHRGNRPPGQCDHAVPL